MLTKGIFLAAFVVLNTNFAMAVAVTPGAIAVRSANNADSDYSYDKRAVADSDYGYDKRSPSNADSDYGYGKH